jgi:GNAT superfamily N-acetyltransferase
MVRVTSPIVNANLVGWDAMPPITITRRSKGPAPGSGAVALAPVQDRRSLIRPAAAPSARGLGIGSRLVGECLGFARAAGYREIVLWTNSVRAEARRIY